jgi:hypothetical protein
MPVTRMAVTVTARAFWVTDGERIKGKWVEVIADRATHQFAGRLEISYDITVSGDSYIGMETVRPYDAAGNLTAGPDTPYGAIFVRINMDAPETCNVLCG